MTSDFEAYSMLCDIVVLCHRPLKDCSFTSNVPLVPIAGVPMIVRCLAPWVACGFRRFYIVHDDDKILGTIRGNFPKELLNGRPLELVLVQLSSDPISEKEALRKAAAMREGSNRERDVIVTDCTTILSKEDIIPAVTNFYASFASGGLLLWKPYVNFAAPKKGAKGHQEEIPASDVPVLAALEEEFAGDVIIGGTSNQPSVAHYRVHFLSQDAKEVPSLQMGFVARRPNLEFRYDLADAGVYILQPWLFNYAISDFEDEDITATLRAALYGIAHGQHWLINRRGDSVSTSESPAKLLNELLSEKNAPSVQLPIHWALVAGESSASKTASPCHYSSTYNATQDTLPPSWDTFRLVSTVVTDAKGIGRRVININRVSDLALATADVASGLFIAANNTASPSSSTPTPRALCDDLFTVLLNKYVEDIRLGRNAAAMSNLKNSIVFTNPKSNMGKGVFTEGSFIAKSAVIGDKVSLLNCVVMEGATVSNGSRLSHCVVMSNAVVPENTNESNKYFDNPQ